MPTTVLADPDGRVIVTDGRNHLELTDERFDIIVTDPPPPIESSGASVISSLEYYQAGRDHLTPGGVMMQWVPFGAPRTSSRSTSGRSPRSSRTSMVIRGAGGYGVVHAGLGRADRRSTRRHPGGAREAGRARGHLVGLRLAGDTVDDWVAVIDRQRWLTGTGVADYVGDRAR